jgi:hypothetical protein
MIRMKHRTFLSLAKELRPYFMQAPGQKVPQDTFHMDSSHHMSNLRVPGICWFAGGSPFDIMITYGIGYTDTINSYWHWYVVDAIKRHLRFKIVYPNNHDKL